MTAVSSPLFSFVFDLPSHQQLSKAKDKPISNELQSFVRSSHKTRG